MLTNQQQALKIQQMSDKIKSMPAVRRVMNNIKSFFEWLSHTPIPYIVGLFFISRVALLITAWFAGYYLSNPTYQHYIDQGWFLSPHFILDIWSRWDARWYLDIVMNGYTASENFQSSYSTIAFFPLFPYLVKAFSFLLPQAFLSQSVYLLIGLLLNNSFFLTGLFFLYRLTDAFFHSDLLNKGVILLVVAYPASFYYSCFYTESLFFLLAVLSLWTAQNQRWFLSAIFCALLSVTRPQGILMLLPIAILLFQSMQWKIRNFPMRALWFLIVPLPLFIHLFHLYNLTGDILAPVSAQSAWRKEFGAIKTHFLDIFQTPEASVFKFDSLLTALFLGLSIYALFVLPSPAYGLFALLIILMPVLSGTSVSMTRYIGVAFPAFIALAKSLKREAFIYSLAAIFFAIQIFFFVGWINYYWIS